MFRFLVLRFRGSIVFSQSISHVVVDIKMDCSYPTPRFPIHSCSARDGDHKGPHHGDATERPQWNTSQEEERTEEVNKFGKEKRKKTKKTAKTRRKKGKKTKTKN